MQTVGPPGDYTDVALSPDETRVAVTRSDPQGVNLDLWLIDLARNTPSRFTFHEAVDRLPVWSPNGVRIAFSSQRDAPESIYQKVASGAGSDELLLKGSGGPVFPTDWSPDGRYLLYVSQDPKTGIDLGVLPLEGDRKPAIYLQTPFNERNGRFSPDGKFIAYASDESGRYEVYVQPFPPSGAKWMISSGGGGLPRWRRDGREIFYVSSSSKLMAVEVKTAPKFEAALPQPLFDARLYTGLNFGVFPYAPAANGQRFLINSMPGETASAPITIVQNWTSGVKR
jgi:Tol biopolymer transport system component